VSPPKPKKYKDPDRELKIVFICLGILVVSLLVWTGIDATRRHQGYWDNGGKWHKPMACYYQGQYIGTGDEGYIIEQQKHNRRS
jgi:hypothetical protein